jgi:hypothetical protein
MDVSKLPDVSASRISVMDMLVGGIKTSIEAIPPEVMAMSEDELNKVRAPLTVDYLLRKSLWEHFERCQKAGIKEITVSEIYEGITSHQNFYQKVLVNPHRLAWIFIKPPTADVLFEEAFFFGMARIRAEVLTMPINEKTMGPIIKAMEWIANRHLGPMIQKMESRNVNLNLTPAESQDPAELETRLGDLKQKLLKAKDVTPIDPE